MKVKRGDWVVSVALSNGPLGSVLRVARDGSWADVRWRLGKKEWSKRMRTSRLIILHTIPVGGGMVVTDVARKKELETP